MMPPVPGSMAAVLLGTAPLDSSLVEMMRAVAISGVGDSSGEEEEEEDQVTESAWNLVLSPGVPEDGALITKPLNVAVLGHADG